MMKIRIGYDNGNDINDNNNNNKNNHDNTGTQNKNIYFFYFLNTSGAIVWDERKKRKRLKKEKFISCLYHKVDTDAVDAEIGLGKGVKIVRC